MILIFFGIFAFLWCSTIFQSKIMYLITSTVHLFGLCNGCFYTISTTSSTNEWNKLPFHSSACYWSYFCPCWTYTVIFVHWSFMLLFWSEDVCLSSDWKKNNSSSICLMCVLFLLCCLRQAEHFKYKHLLRSCANLDELGWMMTHDVRNECVKHQEEEKMWCICKMMLSNL